MWVLEDVLEVRRQAERMEGSALSVTLSMISRQLLPSMHIVFHLQSVHSPPAHSGISGMTNAPWRLPRGRARRTAGHRGRRCARQRGAASRVRLGVGHQLQTLPSPPHQQSWNGRAIRRPLMAPGTVSLPSVPAAAVENPELRPWGIGEDHQLRAERPDRGSAVCRQAVLSPVSRGSAILAAYRSGSSPVSIPRTPLWAVSVVTRASIRCSQPEHATVLPRRRRKCGLAPTMRCIVT